MTSWYDTPSWYDILHAPGTAAEVEGLLRIRDRFARTATRSRQTWFEPACGSGRYLRVLAARGVGTLGIDLNPAMIDYARASFQRRKLRGEFICADMTRPVPGATPRSFDFAFCLINSIRHLPGDPAMLTHLKVVADLIKPGGVYAVGISLTSYGHEFPSEDVWEGARGRVNVTQFVQYLPPGSFAAAPGGKKPFRRAERVLVHLCARTGKTEQHFDSVYDLRAYSGPQWKKLLARSPFKVLGVVDERGEDALTLGNGRWQHPHATGYGVFVLGLA